jgi:ligand-binding sensor domain-containing protein
MKSFIALVFVVCLLLAMSIEPASTASTSVTWTDYTSRTEVTALIDDGNYLWVGSYGGLTKLDKGTGHMIHYNTANSGLPDNMIMSIAKDLNGDLWIGTDNGLARFNGSDWIVYTSDNSPIPRNDITCVAIDENGIKWIGVFMGGLVKFDGSSWTIYNTGNSGLPTDDFRSIAIDTQGNKWIGTNGGGLAKFDGTNWTVYNPSNSGIPGVSVSSIAFDSDGNLWLGLGGWNYPNGLVKFDGTVWTIYNESNSPLPSNTVRTIAVDSEDNKWIGTYKGFAKFDDTNWMLYHAGSLLGYIDEDTYSVMVDSDGLVWVGYYCGLARFNGVEWTTYDTGNSLLSDNYVTSILIDQYGNKWLGAFWGGLVKFDGITWTVYDTRNSNIPNNGAWIHAIDNDGNIWMGVWNRNCIVKFDGADFTEYDSSNSGMPDGYVTSMAIDGYGNKWIGVYNYNTGYGALVKFDGMNWTIYDTTNSGLPYEYISRIAVDTLGNVWLCSSNDPSGSLNLNNQLVKFDGADWVVYDRSNSGLPGDYISSIAIDASNNLWVASVPYWNGTESVGGGLVKYDGMNWVVYDSTNSGLLSNFVNEIHLGQDGNIWASNYMAWSHFLIRFNGSDWALFNLESDPGLPNRRINDWAVDRNGTVWIVTWGGIGQFVPLLQGFVTGGGWINSPPGAYPANLGLTGKANFGFDAKYKNGATLPTGNIEFQFQVANLNFHSASYQWLVVAGTKAQYKGTGTINGEGNYAFMLSAIDGQINGGGGIDKFRIKIWDKDTGEVVYDNQIGAAEDADPTTAIAGGSIVIQK